MYFRRIGNLCLLKKKATLEQVMILLGKRKTFIVLQASI
ncbi:hypothetical protein LEP1GSC039_0954 [Leptospira santarosai str. 2000027870]|nr:hypothetical protein LEP1GSC039_0954 [Leptospira santarosai str. 2000027870]